MSSHSLPVFLRVTVVSAVLSDAIHFNHFNVRLGLEALTADIGMLSCLHELDIRHLYQGSSLKPDHRFSMLFIYHHPSSVPIYSKFDIVVMCSWFGVVLVEKLWTFLLYVSLLARKETWARKHSVTMYEGHRCSSFRQEVPNLILQQQACKSWNFLF